MRQPPKVLGNNIQWPSSWQPKHKYTIYTYNYKYCCIHKYITSALLCKPCLIVQLSYIMTFDMVVDILCKVLVGFD